MVKDGRGKFGNEIITKSKIKCPYCRYEKIEVMPADACIHFYECTNCKTIIKPKQGDCYVFCSYGSVKCPRVQSGTNYRF